MENKFNSNNLLNYNNTNLLGGGFLGQPQVPIKNLLKELSDLLKSDDWQAVRAILNKSNKCLKNDYLKLITCDSEFLENNINFKYKIDNKLERLVRALIYHYRITKTLKDSDSEFINLLEWQLSRNLLVAYDLVGLVNAYKKGKGLNNNLFIVFSFVSEYKDYETDVLKLDKCPETGKRLISLYEEGEFDYSRFDEDLITDEDSIDCNLYYVEDATFIIEMHEETEEPSGKYNVYEAITKAYVYRYIKKDKEYYNSPNGLSRKPYKCNYCKKRYRLVNGSKATTICSNCSEMMQIEAKLEGIQKSSVKRKWERYKRKNKIEAHILSIVNNENVQTKQERQNLLLLLKKF